MTAQVIKEAQLISYISILSPDTYKYTVPRYEVKTCHIVSGNLDIIVHIEATSQVRIKEIWQDLAKIPGILDISTCFSLSSVI